DLTVKDVPPYASPEGLRFGRAHQRLNLVDKAPPREAEPKIGRQISDGLHVSTFSVRPPHPAIVEIFRCLHMRLITFIHSPRPFPLPSPFPFPFPLPFPLPLPCPLSLPPLFIRP